MLYPIKNLLPPTSSPLWAKHQQASAEGEYRWKVNQIATYQTTSIPVTLKAGATYTLSAEGMTDKAQLYIKRIIDGVYAYHIASNNSGNAVTFTAVAGATYSVEFHNGTTLGEGYVYNYQLEEGLRTPFEPYRLGNKKADMPKEVINSDMSGAASHVYPYGNVIQVKEDVRLWGYKIQVGTPTGIFDSVIYEWNNGAIGAPLFREVVNASASGVMNLSYRGTLLKAGKKYYIGRNDPNRDNSSAGNAGVFRKTSMPPADFKYISTLGGSQFYSSNIDFPSTWYYIFALEIESVKNKPAVLVPKKNIYDKKTNPFELGSIASATGIDSASSYVMRSKGYIPVKPNTTYAFIKPNAYNQIAPYPYDEKFNYLGNAARPVINIVGAQCKFTTPAGCYFIRWQFNHPNTSYVMSQSEIDEITNTFQIEEGQVSTDYELYKLINKPSVFFPRKNLIPDFKDPQWFSDYSTSGGTMVVDPTDPYKMKLTMTASAQGRLIWIPVEAGKTYTFSFGKIDGLYRLYKRKVGNHDAPMALVQNAGAGLPNTFTFTPDADYQGFVTIRLTQSIAGTFSFEQLKLEEGSDKTPFQLYVNNMKPAVLYPEKNLFNGIVEAGSFDTIGNIGDSSVNVRGLQYIGVKGGKQYTFSAVGKSNLSPRFYWYDESYKFISSGLGATQTAPINARYLRWHSGGVSLSDKFQIEEGTATPYEPYKLGNKK